MSYYAKIVADSIAFGTRLTTVEVCYPRFILAEDNTHRVFSRNSASSRAIPIERRIEQVLKNPFVPAAFAKNKAGMSADEVLDELANEEAAKDWLTARDACVEAARSLAARGVHKQYANRLLELWSWHTVIKTATEWTNFDNLRDHPAAQPEMQLAARCTKKARAENTPRELDVGEWHLPYVEQADNVMQSEKPLLVNGEPVGRVTWHATEIADRLAISVARCAAISFERQYAEKTVEQYIARHDDLLQSRHLSPFEHQAQVVEPFANPFVAEPPFSSHYRREKDYWVLTGHFCGNFAAPWLQYRKQLPGEAVFTG